MLGNIIKEKRKTIGLTQGELAEKTGIARNTISRYEKGELSPTITALNKIADCMGITTAELIKAPSAESDISANRAIAEFSLKAQRNEDYHDLITMLNQLNDQQIKKLVSFLDCIIN